MMRLVIVQKCGSIVDSAHFNDDIFHDNNDCGDNDDVDDGTKVWQYCC